MVWSTARPFRQRSKHLRSGSRDYSQQLGEVEPEKEGAGGQSLAGDHGRVK